MRAATTIRLGVTALSLCLNAYGAILSPTEPTGAQVPLGLDQSLQLAALNEHLSFVPDGTLLLVLHPSYLY